MPGNNSPYKLPNRLILHLDLTVFSALLFFLSGAALKSVDDAGLGIVRDGTKCGTDKVK